MKYTYLAQKASNTNRNTNFVSLQELRQKILRSKLNFGEKNQTQQKSKTPTKILNLSPAFKNLSIKSQKQVRGSYTSRSPIRKTTQQPKKINSLTERSKNPQNEIKKAAKQGIFNKQRSLITPNNKLYQNPTIWRKKAKQVQQANISKTCETVADNFKSSLRIIFKELVQSYFLQIFLKKKTSYLASEIWVYIFKNTDLQSLSKKQIIQSSQIETKRFQSAMNLLLNKEFKMSQIQNMMKKYLPDRNNVLFEDFEDLFSFQNDFIDFLIEKSYQKKYKSLSPTQLANQLFKSFIELADLQKKLRMICRANENQLIKFVMSISSGPLLKVSSIANFLDQNDKEGPLGMKMTQAKVIKFLDKMLNKKHTKYQFMKWLKMDDKLLR